MRRICLVIAVILSALVPAGASGSSLPAVAIGPRPGPDVLYAPLASAPELENTGDWEAPPLMVSGADAYASGEYVYQDYVYDAYGANTTDLTIVPPPETVPNSSDTLFGGMTGDLAYPTGASYANDAADLLEFRARLTGDDISYRVTLNTMIEPGLAAVAIGRSWTGGTTASDWGYGIGSLGVNVDDVVVAWGTGAESTGDPLPSSVSVERNQIEVTAPLPPGAETIRTYVVVGLWDAGSKTFKAIGEDPTATEPGGAHGATPPPVFNVGFRFDEPVQRGSLHGDPAGEPGARGVAYGSWREHAQAKALQARDISAFGADIDLGTLADEIDESHVPATGYLNRLYVSHLDLGEGLRAARPVMVGRIQPYAVYVPTTYEPGTPAPLHLQLHSLSCSYNQYGVFTPNLLKELGEDRGSFILSPGGRGPDGWWHDAAEVDIFEAWADLAAHYDLDATRTSVGGYSMGGYGTYKMAAQYPDLFAKGFATVGPADESIVGGPSGGLSEDNQNTMRILDNLYNVPLWMWNGVVDELVPLAGVLQFENRLSELGLRHELDVFPSDHFLLSIVDDWARARDELLADVTVDRDPDRVVYRAMPEMDNATMGLVHDHAYWVSGVGVSAGARSGLVDATSFARGIMLHRVVPVVSAGTTPLPHVKKGTDWATQDGGDPENAMSVVLTDVSSATLWLDRAGIEPDQTFTLELTSNAPGTLTLAGSFGTVEVPYAAGVVVIHPFA
jgi:pimeloyl-ACP methyl ester carboxylesterase